MHRLEAPHVYRLYSLSQEAYDEGEIVRRLIEGDESGVFTKAVATTAARILKVGVRGHVEQELNLSAISDNVLKKDYSDASLSKRMSLLLLATDCWLHDQALIDELEKELDPQRMAVERAREERAGTDDLKEMEEKFALASMKMRNDLSPRLHMPSGLRKYLEELGFSGNQALHLERIIEGEKVGGVHARTRRSAAPVTKARTMDLGQS